MYYEFRPSPHVIAWLVAEAEAVTAQIYGNAVQVTDGLYGEWRRNKWFQGAYSYACVGAKKNEPRTWCRL